MKKNFSRRQFIKKSAIGVLGASAMLATAKIITSPPDMALPDPYPELPDQKPTIPQYNNEALFFNEHQYALVATLAALIVPTDDDAGATEAGVVDYIDRFVARSPDRQKGYTRGLTWLDRLSKEKYGKDKNFLNLETAEQIELLRRIDETAAMRGRPVSSFIERVDRKIDKIWNNLVGIGENSRFFTLVRHDVIAAYYSSPVSWLSVGYYGPPQPVGYLDFSEPPSSANYRGSVRQVLNESCQICHTEVKHPTGGLINHTCKTCHRPHSPWPYNRTAFHLEDHLEFVFPTPDRNKEASLSE